MSSLTNRVMLKDRQGGRSPIVAALDVGSSKVSCMIARRADMEGGVIRVCGAGSATARGIRSGAVTDMDALERAIRLAVEQAERAANLRIDNLVLGVSGPELESRLIAGHISMGGREITQSAVRDALNAALEEFERPDREVLHATPLGYALDNAGGVKDPVGMFAEKLSAKMLVVSGPSAPLRNVAQCVSRAHLHPTSFVASSYASGLSVLVDDELEQGVTLVDMGAGVTGMACFYDGAMVHQDALPVGGMTATRDLAQGLGTTFAAAERAKVAYGAVSLADVDPLEEVEAPRLGDDGRLEAGTVTRAELVSILRPRHEELFELLERRLSQASAKGAPLPRRMVLTGGACQIPGLREVAESIFRAPVRLARPYRMSGLGEAFDTPAFSGVTGLLKWEMTGAAGAVAPRHLTSVRATTSSGLLQRTFAWLRENF